MNPNQEYGRATVAPVHILPELVFDISEGQPQHPTFGSTETPINLLPEISGDLLPPEAAVLLD